MKINTDKPYKIFAEVLEQEALNQFESAMQQDFAVKGALMPDAHAGYSLPIGAVVATKDIVVPAWVGYDIGCGMCALQTGFKVEEVRSKSKEIFDQIYRDIPVGFNHNKSDSVWDKFDGVPKSTKLSEIYSKNGAKQLCSLGGGNHFIEIGADENGKVWIIIHSGSRGIGHAVASHYMKLASGDGKAREGHFGFSADSDDGKNYIQDMNFCLEFALENRKQMIKRVVKAIEHTGLVESESVELTLINRNHNHAELKEGLWIHRKGAIHAENGMYGVIPGNMRDGSFIVRGKGNSDALYSSSHGAGRVLGRKEAKKVLSMDNFENTMVGITARVKDDTLDESPFAYKNIFEVMGQQKELVDVVAYVKPIINIKG